MESTKREPITSLAKLNCNYCNDPLSIHPINKVNGKYICGTAKYYGAQSSVYEDLMEVAKFPCLYRNCKSLLTWKQLKDHEEACSHKTMVCPHFNCDEKFEVTSMEEHFASMYLHFVTANPLVLTRKLGNDVPVRNFGQDKKLSLLMYKKKAYIVFILGVCTKRNAEDFMSNYNYTFGVYAMDNGKTDNLKYRVSLKFLNTGIDKVGVENIPIRPFDENLHCFKCLLGSCNFRNHVKIEDKWPLTKFQNIQSLPNMIIEYKIEIYEEPLNEVSKSFNICDELECPICRDYMYAPIYNCSRGHSTCRSCTALLTSCPFCKASVGYSRNFTLENIADKLKIVRESAKEG